MRLDMKFPHCDLRDVSMMKPVYVKNIILFKFNLNNKQINKYQSSHINKSVNNNGAKI